jgi:hypothetical protein
MKAISLWRPWAQLLVHGEKRIETRHWDTKIRGTIAIHASKNWDTALRAVCKREPFFSALRRIYAHLSATDFLEMLNAGELPTGIIGTVDLIEVLPTDFLTQRAGQEILLPDHPSHWPITREELAFGDHSTGRFGWLCANPHPLTTPQPYRGNQGFFEVPNELLAYLPDTRDPEQRPPQESQTP